jgi:hypothetical protein
MMRRLRPWHRLARALLFWGRVTARNTAWRLWLGVNAEDWAAMKLKARRRREWEDRSAPLPADGDEQGRPPP